MGNQTRENRPAPIGSSFNAGFQLGKWVQKKLHYVALHLTEPLLQNIIVCLLQSESLSVLLPFFIKRISLSLWGLTIEAKTGRKSVAVATLLVHSVKVAISRHKMIAIAQGGMLCRGVIWSPNHFESPDSYRNIHNKHRVSIFWKCAQYSSKQLSNQLLFYHDYTIIKVCVSYAANETEN